MFSKLLKRHEWVKVETDCSNALPELNSIYYTDDNRFQIVIPAVRGCLTLNGIIWGIKYWLAKEGIEVESMHVDSSESILNKAAPARIKLNAEVSVENLKTNVYLFTAELVDIAGNRYNFYLITIWVK